MRKIRASQTVKGNPPHFSTEPPQHSYIHHYKRRAPNNEHERRGRTAVNGKHHLQFPRNDPTPPWAVAATALLRVRSRLYPLTLKARTKTWTCSVSANSARAARTAAAACRVSEGPRRSSSGLMRLFSGSTSRRLASNPSRRICDSAATALELLKHLSSPQIYCGGWASSGSLRHSTY